MSDLIKARTGSLDAAAANYMQRAEEFLTALNNVKAAADGLSADWAGQGYFAFDATMARFHQAGRVIVQQLEEISQHVKGSSQAFSTLDAELQQMWSGF